MRIGILLVLALAITFCVAGTGVCAYDWSISTVDSSGDVGLYSSLTIGQDATTSVTYLDDTANILKQAVWTGSSWIFGNLGDAYDVDWDKFAAEAIQGDAATVTDGVLQYRYWENGDWATDIVDGSGDVGDYISLAFDPDGYPAISYYDIANHCLKLATAFAEEENTPADGKATISAMATPAVTLTAASKTITEGQQTTLTWESIDTVTALVSSNFEAKAISGTTVVAPAKTTTYKITVAIAGGKKATATAVVKVLPLIPKVTLVASPASITEGGSATLTWTSTNATVLVSATFFTDTNTKLNDHTVVTPAKTTAYKITVATAGGKKATATAVVKVLPLIPKVTLVASPASITEGGSATLNWTSTNATILVSSTFAATDLNDHTVVTPAKTTAYKITVATAGGKKATATLKVVVKPLIPTVRLTATPTPIGAGSYVQLTWTSTNAANVTSSNFGVPGTLLNGTKAVIALKATTYKITVATMGGKKATASASVKVGKAGPTVSNVSVSPTSVNSGDLVTVTASASAISPKTVASVTATVIDSNFNVLYVPMAISGDQYSGTFTAPSNSSDTGTSVTCSVYVTAKDSAGVSYMSSGVSLSVAGGAPTISSMSVSPTSVKPTGDDVIIKANVSVVSPKTVVVTAEVVDAELNVTSVTMDLSGGQFVGKFRAPYNFTSTGKAAVYWVYVTAKDSAGISRKSSGVSFQVAPLDLPPPPF